MKALKAWKEKLRFQWDLFFHFTKSPFGPEYQEAWNHRYEMFGKWDKGIQTDVVGLYSVTPEKTAKEIAQQFKGLTVVDAFCGIGGSAIAFAAHCSKVYAVDLDSGRLQMAKHNAQVYSQTNIEFIQGNFLELASTLKANAVFLDPPWGGPSFVQKEKFGLIDFNPQGKVLLNLAFKHFSRVALRVPEQFDFAELAPYPKYTVQPNYLHGRLISQTIYFNF